MADRTLPVDPEQAAALLLAIQAGDAVACGIPLPIIQRDLERLGCSPALQRAIPVLKAASAVGLLAGRKDPRLGRLTTDALMAYFVCALGAHARVRDPLWRWAAATGMLGLTLVARRAFREDSEVIDLVPEEEIDLTGEAIEDRPAEISARR